MSIDSSLDSQSPSDRRHKECRVSIDKTPSTTGPDDLSSDPLECPRPVHIRAVVLSSVDHFLGHPNIGAVAGVVRAALEAMEASRGV